MRNTNASPSRPGTQATGASATSSAKQRWCLLGALFGVVFGIATSGFLSSLLLQQATSRFEVVVGEASNRPPLQALPPHQSINNQSRGGGLGSGSGSGSGAAPAALRRLHCSEVFNRTASGELPDPNDTGGDGIARHKRLTTTEPPFWVSVHHKNADGPRWAIVQFGFYYERFLTELVKEILVGLNGGGGKEGEAKGIDANGRGFFVDVGMNVGWFSLWARALGSNVVGFEPNPANRLRFCESLRLNGWSEDSVQIFGDAVGETEATMSLVLRGSGNPGEAALMASKQAERIKESVHQVVSDVRVVTLDNVAEREGWFEPDRPPIALLKVDVEGHDPEVFFGAKRLVRSGLVKNIFMEYSCEMSTAAKMKSVAAQLESNYSLANIGSWNGAPIQGAMGKVVKNGAAVLQGTLSSRLYDFCKTHTSNQLNLWWKLKE